MNTPDLMAFAVGSLRRMKLRTFLTVSGVVIAIAAFVAMLSFGAGMQENVSREFDELGLFTTIQVFPSRSGDASDTTAAVVLDDEAVEKLSRVDGVNLAYPLEAFAVTVVLADTQVNSTAQALTRAASRTKRYARMAAGDPLYTGDDLREALVTRRFLERVGRRDPDSIVGERIVVSVEVASLDSGAVHMLRGADPDAILRMTEMLFGHRADREDIADGIRKEMTGALQRFLDGYLHAQAVIVDTLVIRGVLDHRMGGPSREGSLVIPAETARRLSPGSLGNNPAELFAYLNSGAPIDFESGLTGKNYSNATVHLSSQADPAAVADTLRAMGYRVFSYAEEFREMRRFFLVFDVALGVVGFIALVVASLGIVNTLVTSIVERRKEIGILKSLGADEGSIRLLFLVESGVIGAIGSSLGIVLGWGITRVASVVARIFLEKQGAPDMDLFALPLWLILAGFFFGLGVSVAAGLYPAARAAAVDPVEALRND